MKIGIIIEGPRNFAEHSLDFWDIILQIASSLSKCRHKIVFYVQRNHYSKLLNLQVKTITTENTKIVFINDIRVSNDEADDFYSHEHPTIIADLLRLLSPDIDLWLCPDPGWAAVQQLIGPKICIFTGFVQGQFPSHYTEDVYRVLSGRYQAAGSFFNRIICTSQYVKSHHAEKICQIPSEKISIIEIPPITRKMAFNQCNVSDVGKKLRVSLEETLPLSITGRQRDLFLHHTVNLPFEAMSYVFIKTDNLPYRNVKLAAEAIEILVRRHHAGIIALTTTETDFHGRSELELYLLKHKLHHSFLTVGRLNEDIVDLLYKLAQLTVLTSPFEGFFPLPFCESLSNNTPCIIAYSPAYDEFVLPDERAYVFFQPNPEDLARAIKNIITKREEVLRAQKQILKRMNKYTWEILAQKFCEQITLADCNAAAQR